MLDTIPGGTHCFVDANIFCYYLIDTPPLTEQCARFIKRVNRREIISSSSAVIIAETAHKIMLAEAIQQHGLDHKGLAHRLQRRRDLIASLNEHQKVASLIRTLAIHIEPVTLELIERAASISTQHCLLTNDALTIAAMEKLAIYHLATNDDDFDVVPGITLWKPR
jgi:predicted nucleic acid-binding protein